MFTIPSNAKVIIGLGAGFVGAFAAYQAAQDGLEVTEEHINHLSDKFKNRKNTQPESVE